MIGRLRGTLAEKQPPHLILDVNGLGYELEVPMTTLYRLPSVGEPLTLHTHLVVREDAQLLYGFANPTERSLFRQLIKANGIGPKMALTILSGLTATQFVRCVQQDDISTLVKLPGVGKKTAERLLVEMRDRLKDWGLSIATPVTDHLVLGDDEVQSFQLKETPESDAISALVSLGYSQAQASLAVKKVYHVGLTSEQLIKASLKSMI